LLVIAGAIDGPFFNHFLGFNDPASE
jgi:hypothetical protein